MKPGDVLLCEGNPQDFIMTEDIYHGAMVEIGHMRDCVAILERIEPASRQRVMRYLWDRYVVNAPKANDGTAE